MLQQVEDFSAPAVTANDCFRPVSRFWDRISRPEQLLASLPQALSVLTDPAECGPVTLALPQDVQAQGLDTGEGPSNSEVILAAAEKGFRGGGYKKVFTQYKTVAEEQINKEKVPDGYRFYVHRYFQLIRPRE